MSKRTLPGAGIIVITAAAVLLSSCLTTTRPGKVTGPGQNETAEQITPAVKAYRKAVEDRLGSFWYQLVKIHEDDLQLGTVEVTFDIPAAGGKVHNVRVSSNTGGRMDKLVALRAIDQLRAPPIPSQVLAELHADHVQFEESFAVYASR
jgi:Flp pilus assembly protein TadD